VWLTWLTGRSAAVETPAREGALVSTSGELTITVWEQIDDSW
jgi:hypothetical protein